MKSKQELFDTVARHLLTQRRQSKVVGGQCRYRWEDPWGRVLRCAIGCLIPDEAYKPSYEGRPVDSVNEAYRIVGERINGSED